MVTEIRKRDGSVVAFSPEKITLALTKAMAATKEGGPELAVKLTNSISSRLEMLASARPNFVPDVEQVQDAVEIALIETGLAKTAKAYILYREEHRHLREAQKQILNGRTTRLPFTLNALRVVAKRYLQRDENDDPIETPEEMYHRVAVALAAIEKNYGKSGEEIEEWREKFYEVLSRFEFTPAGRTITNAGAETPVVANCIVLHFKDDMASIFETLKEATLLQQAGSGLGFAFHLLRPAGMRAKRTQGRSSGPISFLQVYNQAFGIIQQQNRHGANMAVMRVDHPDILDFVHCKEKEGSLVNFNISVGLTDEFMSAVDSKDPNPWMCDWKGTKMFPRRVKRTDRGVVEEIIEEKMTAHELFEEIVSAAWSNGEPGVVFPDPVNRTNPVPRLGRLETCNPCGEQFLHDADVCNLGSVNLAQFAENGQLKEERLREVTRIAIRMLDNVIDQYDFPVERVQTTAKGNRRIGLGVMGFADLLYQLRIGYDTTEGFAMAERVMGIIQEESHKTSQRLAEEKGVFPNWQLSIFADRGVKMRNAALTTVAPTGTISMMFDASGGVEPFFALAYHKSNILDGKMKLNYVNKYLEEELKQRGLYTEEIVNKIVKEGTLQNIDEIPADMKRVYVTAMDIAAKDHIHMQAAFQKHVDNSISKTCNFPNSATHEDVMNGYLLGWKLGCKGLTVYRDGSRDIQILNLNKEKEVKKPDAASEEAPRGEDEAPVKKHVEPVSATVHEVVQPIAMPVQMAAPVMQVSQPGGGATMAQSAPVSERFDIMAEKVTKHSGGDLCPECSSKLDVGSGCKSCPGCGWAICSL